MRKATKYLMVLLRLAMVFNRGRSEVVDTYLDLSVSRDEIKLTLPTNWLNDHPLTEADLLQEADYLQSADFTLVVK